jgi:hypothetical protein
LHPKFSVKKKGVGILCFCVSKKGSLLQIGLERTSMQCVFHLQHYCVNDADVIWDAEFEDMVLINPKNERIYDHSKLSWWRAV